VAAGVTTTAPGPSTMKAEASAEEKGARAFVELMEKGKFEEATKTFDEKMSKALPAEKLAALWKQLSDAGGKYIGVVGEVRVKPIGGFTAVYVPTRWEKNAVDMKVVYSKERKITGLWVVKPGGD
jgi:hypothetical protein